MIWKPLNDHIIVKPSEVLSETPGGIVIPEIAKKKPTSGKVVAVGPGKMLENGTRSLMDVIEQDVVLYTKYSGIPIEVGDEKFLVLNENDLLAVGERQ